VHCKLQGVCYVISERHQLWSTNGFKLDLSFYPLSFVRFHCSCAWLVGVHIILMVIFSMTSAVCLADIAHVRTITCCISRLLSMSFCRQSSQCHSSVYSWCDVNRKIIFTCFSWIALCMRLSPLSSLSSPLPLSSPSPSLP